MIETKTLTYKDAAWLGEFPAHWQVMRIKKLFQETDHHREYAGRSISGETLIYTRKCNARTP